MKYSKICKEFKNFKERLSSELDSKNAFFTLFSGQDDQLHFIEMNYRIGGIQKMTKSISDNHLPIISDNHKKLSFEKQE